MSQERREQLRRFEQKMREQGADGFADGPRPWEHWDESGHQANNRIWEGSARRIYPGSRRARSLGYRLLSVLAFIALTTLLVGIGGVYFSHIQSRQLAETGVEPLPFTDQNQPAATVANSEALIDGTAIQTDELNVLSAPAAGSGATREQDETAVEIAAADNESSPDRDESAPHTAMAMPPLTTAETVPPETQGAIDSVAIETIVTEQSVTTTVYTRHPRQEEAEVVAAIETTPPPFAHRIIAREAPDSQPPTLATADHELSSEAAVAASTANLQLLPIDAPAVLESQPDVLPDNPPAEQSGAITTVAVADMGSDTAATGSLADAAPETTDEQRDAPPDSLPTEQLEIATVAVAATGMDSATSVKESPAAAAAEVSAEPDIESVTPAIPVTKTGGWVINLSSYTRESTANRKLVLFQQQGIDAEVFAVTINDKPMYRIRLAGFASRRAAQAEVKPVEQLLGLEGAWVSTR